MQWAHATGAYGISTASKRLSKFHDTMCKRGNILVESDGEAQQGENHEVVLKMFELDVRNV